MTLVCNAGPLIALAKIDSLELLQMLGSRIVVPEIVFHEVIARPGHDATLIVQASEQFLEVTKEPGEVDGTARQACQELDAGERSVLLVATSLESPVVAALDDAAGRRVARSLGVRLTGFPGILIAAKQQGFLDAVVPKLELARSRGYWLSDQLIATARELCGE